MIRHTFTLCFLTLLLTVGTKTFSQQGNWQLVNGMPGGTVNAIEQIGNEIWIATGAGIYITSDEGLSWQVHPSLTMIDVLQIKNYADSLYIIYRGNDSLRLIKSVNGGANWSNPQLMPSVQTYSFDLTKCGNRFIFQSMLVSDDDCNSWTVDTMNYTHVNTSTCLTNLYRNGYQINYFYDNRTNQFTVIDSFQYPDPIVLKSDTLLFRYAVLGSVIKLCRSEDFGQTWDTVYTFPPTAYFVNIQQFGNDLYVGFDPAGTNCIVSSDGGITWQTLNYYSPILYSLGDYIYLPGSGFLCNGYGGVSLIDSSVYNSRSNGLDFRNFISLFQHHGNIYAATNGGAFRSTDQGLTWQLFSYRDIFELVAMGDTLVGNGGRYSDTPDNFLVYSIDDGATWNERYLSQVFFTNYAAGLEIEKDSTGALYCTFGNWIRRSTDFGATWQDVTPVIFPLGYSNSFEMHRNEFYVLNDYTTLYKLSNGSWSQLYSSTTWRPLTEFDNAYLVLSSADSLHYSTDGGLTWQSSAGNGLPIGNNGNRMFPTKLVNYSGMWMGSIPNHGVYYSADQGDNWTGILTPFSPSAPVLSTGSELYCASISGGLWRTTLQTNVATVTAKKDLLTYPNPASSWLVLESPMQGQVTICNTTGQTVKTVEKPAELLRLNVSDLPSGIYFGMIRSATRSVSFRFVKE